MLVRRRQEKRTLSRFDRFLGNNDLSWQSGDASALSAIASLTNTFTLMASNIFGAVPGIRVGLCVTIPPTADRTGQRLAEALASPNGPLASISVAGGKLAFRRWRRPLRPTQPLPSAPG